MTASAPQPQILHATTIALAGRAALIRGAAGSGKSGLALQLMAIGAALVSDDRTRLTRSGDRLMADAPDAIRGLIEARGIGLLLADPAGLTPLACVVDLDLIEDHRLPPRRTTRLLDLDLPLFHKVDSPAWPAGLAQYLRGGRRDTE